MNTGSIAAINSLAPWKGLTVIDKDGHKEMIYIVTEPVHIFIPPLSFNHHLRSLNPLKFATYGSNSVGFSSK